MNGAAISLFLLVGLFLSIALAGLLDSPRSYWIALIFVMRGLLPLHAQRPEALRFGKGAAIGVAAAIAVESLGLPAWTHLALSLCAAWVGMRYMVHPLPISSAAFSAAILLGTAPTLPDAILRLQAIALVVALVLVLALAFDVALRRLTSRTSAGEEHGS